MGRYMDFLLDYMVSTCMTKGILATAVRQLVPISTPQISPMERLRISKGMSVTWEILKLRYDLMNSKFYI